MFQRFLTATTASAATIGWAEYPFVSLLLLAITVTLIMTEDIWGGECWCDTE